MNLQSNGMGNFWGKHDKCKKIIPGEIGYRQKLSQKEANVIADKPASTEGIIKSFFTV